MNGAVHSDQTIIEVSGLTFGFDREPVLESVSFRISKGAFVVVIGPNGGGKTTLLHLILGLYQPDRGRIRVFGEEPGRHPQRTGYVPQHGNLAPGFPGTVEQVVLMGLPHGGRHGPGFRRDELDRAAEAMQRAGILELARRSYGALSGGQRQRALIARALITKPELLLLDEPFSNIDPYGRACIHEMLEDLGTSLTRVMVSHDLGITRQSVSQVLAINRIALSGEGPWITDEMLELMYGRHDERCPMSEHLLVGYGGRSA
ncbi:metal ABC transporter ATP-binding protein [Wenzhouxiangella sp. EGI_FJ10305]|uniref:metal ABC transporter ATP-binding protein n=1 Tax=Wenzhouxiangella sp. EGI_FJ10305 TaxID=3243768 RepID=UPI0035E10642